MSSVLVVIPARFNSTRFPGKLLANLGGKSVLQRTCERCLEVVQSSALLVATDDQRIVEHCREISVKTMLTSTKHLTGTDRVAEVAASTDSPWYVNVQGDEPFLEPVALEAMLIACQNPWDGVAVLNAYCEISSEEEFRSPSVPKVVCTAAGRLLFISRAPIPTTKELTFLGARRQVGLYGFRRDALGAFTATSSKTPLESIEDIEILRFLEIGYEVRMIDVPSGGLAIDTPADLKTAHQLL